MADLGEMALCKLKILQREVLNQRKQAREDGDFDTYDVLRQQNRTLQYEIEQRSKKLKEAKSVTITNHAVMRYLQRIKGVDINRIRKKVKNHSDKEFINDRDVVNYILAMNKQSIYDLWDEILPSYVRTIIKDQGCGMYPVRDGMNLLVRKNVVMTIYGREQMSDPRF